MSHWYGSLRGIIGVLFVAISAVSLMSPAAIASADSPAAGSSVVVSATIAPVRIIVIDKHNQIIEILSNGPSNVTPTVYRDRSDGERVELTDSIQTQYAVIKGRANFNKTGVIYRKKHSTGSESRVRVIISSSKDLLRVASFTVRPL